MEKRAIPFDLVPRLFQEAEPVVNRVMLEKSSESASELILWLSPKE
jgi:hypothetical protein